LKWIGNRKRKKLSEIEKRKKKERKSIEIHWEQEDEGNRKKIETTQQEKET